jgi:hypothetical protein
MIHDHFRVRSRGKYPVHSRPRPGRGCLTDEGGKVAERGYRNIWRNEQKRLFTGRAQARIPSKAISDELWGIAEYEGWANLLGDGADLWQRVSIPGGPTADASVGELMNAFSDALAAANCPAKEAPVFGGQNNADEGHVIFFSPKAASIGAALLRRFSAVPCQQPDLGELRKVRL